ncbi:hypothetical protein Rhopal_001963-T1 [Rhodotorula paludigena]|uniref:Translation initiation factor IF-3 n=1 Tax=Rhodotorula paludigena TaxID=86838 RepID=A0AAV5GI38_9BASI|nr:hypothetical protein Rhopal_001963-T1 [Rhodotorula paludigena]
MLASRIATTARAVATLAAAPRALPRLCPACSSPLLAPASRQPLRRAFAASAVSWLPPRPATAAAKGSRVVKDEDIPHEVVVLVDPASKSLLPPSTLSSLLASLDRTRFAIQLVDAAHDPPICRILDKKEQYERERERKVRAQERAKEGTGAVPTAGPPKEVHLTWGVSAHDLEHKLKKGREILTKGGRVLVCLADKKRATVKVSHEVRQSVIRQVDTALQDVGELKGRPANRDGMVVLEFKAR